MPWPNSTRPVRTSIRPSGSGRIQSSTWGASRSGPGSSAVRAAVPGVGLPADLFAVAPFAVCAVRRRTVRLDRWQRRRLLLTGQLADRPQDPVVGATAAQVLGKGRLDLLLVDDRARRPGRTVIGRTLLAAPFRPCALRCRPLRAGPPWS